MMTGMCAGCEVEMEVEMEMNLWRQSVGQGRCVVMWEASAFPAGFSAVPR